MNTLNKKETYTTPCILSVERVETEQGICASSSTMTVGGTGSATPEVTDWGQQEEGQQTLDI